MSERMSDEELDRLDSGIVVSLDAGDLYADDADGLRRMVAEARRARAAEERLTKALEDAPHGADCEEGEPEAFRKGRIVSRAKCSCFKARAKEKQ